VSPNRVIEYRGLLISPGDVDAERDAVAQVIQLWNASIGRALGARVDLVRWETHAIPDASRPPQDALNQQLVDDCDFGIAIFWTRLGSPTRTHPSGSVEEIQRLRDKRARVLVYFSNAPIPQDRLKDEQFDELMAFKETLRREGLLGSYDQIADLTSKVQLHLTSVVASLLQRDRGEPSPEPSTPPASVLTAPTPDVRVIIFPAETIPRTPGVNHLLGIRIQNHSPVVVFVTGVSVYLKSNRALLLYRDAVTGAELAGRTPLRPGDSLHWAASGDALLAEHAVDEFDDLVVHDAIGRAFKPTPGELRRLLETWAREDAEGNSREGDHRDRSGR